MRDSFGRPRSPNAKALAEYEAMAADALLYAMDGEDPARAILNQEARGGRQLAASDTLPNPGDSADARIPFEAIGIVFGGNVEGDPLFVNVTLPDGWTRRLMDDPRGFYVVDERGEERISGFYKAASYDRYASMHTIALCAECSHSGTGHPYAGRSVEASPKNNWTPVDAPQPCVREGCPCKAFRRP